MVHIVVDGFPVPAARPRFVRAGPFVRTYNPAHVNRYRERLQAVAADQMKGQPLLDGPLAMAVKCIMPYPTTMSKKQRAVVRLPHTKKPDLSNLLKNFEDALNGIVYVDDARLWNITIEKIYGDKPRVELWIYNWPDLPKARASEELPLFR